MAEWDGHGAEVLPNDPLVPGKLEEWDLAARIADENVAIGKDLDAGKPTNAQLRKVFPLHRPDDFASLIHLDH
jgi:hypothetical protein